MRKEPREKKKKKTLQENIVISERKESAGGGGERKGEGRSKKKPIPWALFFRGRLLQRLIFFLLC